MTDHGLPDIRKQCIDRLYLVTDNVLQYILDEEKDSELAMLKNYVGDYCRLEAMQDLEAEALAMATRETDASNVNSLDEKYIAHLKSLQAHRRQNVDDHPFMVGFEKRINNALQANSKNLNESDVAITATQELSVDPITMRRIAQPVRSALCGHVYERAAILGYLESRSGARCPVACCASREPLQPAHLVQDAAPAPQ